MSDYDGAHGTERKFKEVHGHPTHHIRQFTVGEKVIPKGEADVWIVLRVSGDFVGIEREEIGPDGKVHTFSRAVRSGKLEKA